MQEKVAISVQTLEGLQSSVDPRFGRCPAFIVVTQSEDKWSVLESVENTAANEAQGAGGAAAAMLAERGVNSVLSGRFGPKAYQALEKFGIKMLLVEDRQTVSEALDALQAGTLEEMKITVY